VQGRAIKARGTTLLEPEGSASFRWRSWRSHPFSSTGPHWLFFWIAPRWWPDHCV